MIGPAVYESPRATYVSGGGGGLVGKQAAANSPNVSTTTSRRPVTAPPPDDRIPLSTIRSASEREKSPVAGNTLELMSTAFVEREAGPRDQGRHALGDQDLARIRRSHRSRRDVHADAAEV